MHTVFYTTIVALALALSAGTAYIYTDVFDGVLPHTDSSTATVYATEAEEQSTYVRLAMEAYDTITNEYWQEVVDGDLAELYLHAMAKVFGTEDIQDIDTTRADVATLLLDELQALNDDEARREATRELINVVLFNLAPQGRNRLLSTQEETKLRNTVANINPESNLYDALGVADGADRDEVTSAFEETKATLSASSSPDAKAKLREAEYAHEVLANEETKQRYDASKVEPTVSYEYFGDDVLYINISQIAPTGVQEFVEGVNEATATGERPYLILDLRGNIGGSLDFARYFLGVFLGPHQYVADLFSQGEREPMRTPEHVPQLKELQQFQEIVILVDEKTQSTAEVTTAVFKRMNLAVIVGETTKGWGTVENTFPLETQIKEGESYSLFLVHSLALGDSQQPIEGRGVEPDVDVTSANWKNELQTALDVSSLVSAVGEVMGR